MEPLDWGYSNNNSNLSLYSFEERKIIQEAYENCLLEVTIIKNSVQNKINFETNKVITLHNVECNLFPHKKIRPKIIILNWGFNNHSINSTQFNEKYNDKTKRLIQRAFNNGENITRINYDDEANIIHEIDFTNDTIKNLTNNEIYELLPPKNNLNRHIAKLYKQIFDLYMRDRINLNSDILEIRLQIKNLKNQIKELKSKIKLHVKELSKNDNIIDKKDIFYNSNLDGISYNKLQDLKYKMYEIETLIQETETNIKESDTNLENINNVIQEKNNLLEELKNISDFLLSIKNEPILPLRNLLNWGFKYLFNGNEQTTIYTEENRMLIQDAYNSKKNEITIIHTTLAGRYAGQQVEHNINFRVYIVHNKTFNYTYKLIPDEYTINNIKIDYKISMLRNDSIRQLPETPTNLELLENKKIALKKEVELNDSVKAINEKIELMIKSINYKNMYEKQLILQNEQKQDLQDELNNIERIIDEQTKLENMNTEINKRMNKMNHKQIQKLLDWGFVYTLDGQKKITLYNDEDKRLIQEAYNNGDDDFKLQYTILAGPNKDKVTDHRIYFKDDIVFNLRSVNPLGKEYTLIPSKYDRYKETLNQIYNKQQVIPVQPVIEQQLVEP